MDWLAIRAEYLKGGISQRKLAEKHGISYNTLKQRAKLEEWATQRSATHRKATAKAQQEIEEEIADDVVAAIRCTMRCSYLILEHLAKQVENLPQTTGTRLENTVTETRADGQKSTTKLVMDLASMATILEKLAALYGTKDGNATDVEIEDLRDLRRAIFGEVTS